MVCGTWKGQPSDVFDALGEAKRDRRHRRSLVLVNHLPPDAFAPSLHTYVFSLPIVHFLMKRILYEVFVVDSGWFFLLRASLSHHSITFVSDTGAETPLKGQFLELNLP